MTRSRTARTLIAAAAALTAIAACQAPEPKPDAPRAPTTTEAIPAAAPAPDADAEPLYVTITRAEYPDVYAGVPTDTMVEAVEGTCYAFDQGATAEQIALMALDAVGYSQEAATAIGYLLGAGVELVCPEHSAALASL